MTGEPTSGRNERMSAEALPARITIDEAALDYLPRTLVPRLHELPYRVADVYRRLTL